MALEQTEEKQLGQARPANTTAVSLYVSTGVQAGKLFNLFIANTTGTAATYRVFYDVDGTTYDQTTALYYDVSLAANTTDKIVLDIPVTGTLANLAIATGTNSALTFTLFGEEKVV